MKELWKADTDVPNVLWIFAANSVEKRGYELRVLCSEIEAITSIKQLGAFAVDRLVRAKKLRRDPRAVLKVHMVLSPRINGILIHYEVREYPIADLPGEAGQGGRHVSGRAAVQCFVDCEIQTAFFRSCGAQTYSNHSSQLIGDLSYVASSLRYDCSYYARRVRK